VLSREGQLDQRGDRAVGAQHRGGELEERIRPGVETVVEPDTKVGQDTRRGISGLFRGETLHQRPFLHATLLDTSKREERPSCCPGNEPRSAGQMNGRG
jgi:hypothetical protein